MSEHDGKDHRIDRTLNAMKAGMPSTKFELNKRRSALRFNPDHPGHPPNHVLNMMERNTG
jgi:hypothetical protein